MTHPIRERRISFPSDETEYSDSYADFETGLRKKETDPQSFLNAEVVKPVTFGKWFTNLVSRIFSKKI